MTPALLAVCLVLALVVGWAAPFAVIWTLLYAHGDRNG